jgi:DsbC/DsbD-like thiol-disulfide interchange protein
MSPAMKVLSASAALVTLLAGSPVHASSSDWFETDGARVRLVTTGKPNEEGRLLGILDIELKPGWKTYWRDPGDAGVPPTLDVSTNPNIAKAEFDFPAPQRHDEGDFKWAGYDYPVALPVTFTLKDPAGPAMIDAGVFLGVCETICVPVQAKLAFDPADDPDNPDDASAVSAAFAAIPSAATPVFGVKVAEKASDAKVVLEAVFPGNPATAELFVAGGDGYVLTVPVKEERDGKTFFSLEVTRPDEKPSGPGLHYTLVTDAGAVSGLLPYF